MLLCCRKSSGIKVLLLEGFALARSIKKDHISKKFVRQYGCIFTKALVPIPILLETYSLAKLPQVFSVATSS